MGVMTLRRAAARPVPGGGMVALDQHYAIYVVGEHARRHRARNAAPDDDRLTMCGGRLY
jgi:hypothetical protein